MRAGRWLPGDATPSRHAPASPRGSRRRPVAQFAAWWERAEAEVPLPDAICLATVDADGAPDARMVLLKGFDADGFRFHTNYESAKGRQLAANDAAAIVVYWRELDRQVRIRGSVERLSAEESDAYFADPPARARASAPGPRRRAGRWRRPRGARRPGPRGRGALRRAARSRGPSTGAGSCCALETSSSGRARSAACTTASATRARARAGGSSGSGRERRRRAGGILETSVYYPHDLREETLDLYERDPRPAPGRGLGRRHRTSAAGAGVLLLFDRDAPRASATSPIADHGSEGPGARLPRRPAG